MFTTGSCICEWWSFALGSFQFSFDLRLIFSSGMLHAGLHPAKSIAEIRFRFALLGEC
jgi:hypothetical protein